MTSTALISLFSLRTICGGVPRGTATPHQFAVA
jgi:hypothetical protein